MDNCNTASESMPDLPNSVIEMGLLILYKCKFDGAWCRGQIVPNDYVLLVDFGSKEPFTRMRAKLIPESLVQFPALARQCCLTGVKPSANVWSKNAKKVVSKMTPDFGYLDFRCDRKVLKSDTFSANNV